MELRVRERRFRGDREIALTSSCCVGCDGVFLTPSSSESGSDSDGVHSSLLQTSQCVHCQGSINRGGVRVSETVSGSGRVGDGV